MHSSARDSTVSIYRWRAGFLCPGWAKRASLRIRADAYNVLNHANLGNPDAQLNDPEFGVATYGRQGYPSGFPAVAPLNETPREIQLSVRVVVLAKVSL